MHALTPAPFPLKTGSPLPRVKRIIANIPPDPPRGAGGGGGKGGGGSGSTPTEDPDSLQSVAFVQLLDLICEGEIQGLVKGGLNPSAAGIETDAIFLDNVPITSNGFPNFKGYTAAWVNGTQAQPVIPGFGSVFSTVTLGTEVKFGVPIQASIDNPEANAVVMTVGVGALYSANTATGDVHGSTVEVVFEYKPANSSTWIQAVDMIITGKTRSKYERSARFDLTGTGPWIVRCRRLTGDSTAAALVNNTYLDAVSSVVDQRLRYPNSALVGLNIDARQFTSVPGRSYLIDGMIIRVPNNYDPEFRTYSGAWNGGFKLAYSNNPAWCFYDLVTSTRYGLGNYLQDATIDKTALYQIGQYCDEMVPDGFGGQEPRFTCNMVINTAKEAYQCVQDMLSIFRGMSYWSSGNILVTQDAPRTPSKTFTRANVIGGKFTYQGTALKDRHSVALVRWNDPDQQYQQNTEYVENADALARFGVRVTEIMAVGCTSRGQAHRLGQWALTSELSDTDQLSFTAGLEGATLTPGEIIYVADPTRSEKRIGGRIVGGDINTITLDAPVVLDPGQAYSVIYYDGSGNQHTAPVLNTNNTTAVLQFVSPVANVPQAPFIWILTGSNLVPQTFRVLNVKESAPNQYDVMAVTYNASKYSAIDFNTKLQLPPIGYGDALGAALPSLWSLTETTFLSAPGVIGSKIIMSWSGNTTHFMIQWRVNGGIWMSDTVRSPGYEIDGVTKGDVYDFKIYGISADTTLSPSLDETYTIQGSSAPPAACTSLQAFPDFRSATLYWAAPPDLDLDYFQVAYSGTNNLATAGIVLDKVGTTNVTVGGLTPTVPYYFWVRAVDTSGNVGPWNSNVGTQCIPKQGGTLDIENLSVTNAKIANAAIGTANIQNAAITAALIANAQILTAHIGVAQIDTLRIGPNAVTTQASWTFGTSVKNSPQSVGYNTAGGNVSLLLYGYANGVTFDGIGIPAPSSAAGFTSTGAPNYAYAATIALLGPGAGGHTITVDGGNYQGGNLPNGCYLNIIALEYKR
jgi:predicted phage tail protein